MAKSTVAGTIYSRTTPARGQRRHRRCERAAIGQVPVSNISGVAPVEAFHGQQKLRSWKVSRTPVSFTYSASDTQTLSQAQVQLGDFTTDAAGTVKLILARTRRSRQQGRPADQGGLELLLDPRRQQQGRAQSGPSSTRPERCQSRLGAGAGSGNSAV